MSRRKPCPPLLTVVFRNDSPLIHCNDSPSYRSVTVELTAEQREVLSVLWAGQTPAGDYYEAISKCFIEPEDV